MDISNRNVSAPAGPGGQNFTSAPSSAKKPKSKDDSKWARIGLVAAAVAIAVLLAGISVLAFTGNNKDDAESSYVDTSKLQAVFLNTGQVYFGNVKTLNDDYMRLTNIYYLQTSGGENNTNANVTLVKLGCELHEPDDQMLINRDQITFWENLHDSGQVAEAVANFKKQNPDGQKCADQSTSAGTNSTNATQNASGNNSNTGNTAQ